MANLITGTKASVTVEAAFGIGSIIVFFSYCLLFSAGFVGHIKCVDGAREIARAESLRDKPNGNLIKTTDILPEGADYRVEKKDNYVQIMVDYRPKWLFGLELGAKSIAFLEKDFYE